MVAVSGRHVSKVNTSSYQGIGSSAKINPYLPDKMPKLAGFERLSE